MPQRDIVMANSSVRLSVTLWYSVETNAHIVKVSNVFPQSGRGTTRFFERYRHYKIPMESSAGGVKHTGSVEIICDYQ